MKHLLKAHIKTDWKCLSHLIQFCFYSWDFVIHSCAGKSSSHISKKDNQSRTEMFSFSCNICFNIASGAQYSSVPQRKMLRYLFRLLLEKSLSIETSDQNCDSLLKNIAKDYTSWNINIVFRLPYKMHVQFYGRLTPHFYVAIHLFEMFRPLLHVEGERSTKQTQ